MKYFLVLFCVLTHCSSQYSNRSETSGRAVSSSSAVVDESGYLYNPLDKSCDGYPALKVQTLPGTCLGLVLPQSQIPSVGGKKILKMPRTLVGIPQSSDFLLVDMGGWAPKAGKLFWLRSTEGSVTLTEIKRDLTLPHGIVYSAKDGYFYLGEDLKITRFHFANGKITDETLVIDQLPDVENHMHPLTQLVLNPKTNDLYINSGAPSDHCSQDLGSPLCAQAEGKTGMARILRIKSELLAQLPQKIKVTDIETVAYGLRNSMAMAIHSSGEYLVQGENGRDFKEMEEPYEEMNLIQIADEKYFGFHYGWPYCYNFYATSPEWAFAKNSEDEFKKKFGEKPFQCDVVKNENDRSYKRPHSLIPPHAAPLHAAYYEGAMFKNLFSSHLLMSWHGYRPTGQRFVAYKVNEYGFPLPSGKPLSSHSFGVNEANGCAKPTSFSPRGKYRDRHVPYTEVISGWGAISKIRPRGAPTGFATARDGSIWIVEDKNKTIVRLAKSETVNHQDACGKPKGNKLLVDPSVPLLVWRNYLKENKSGESEYLSIQNYLLSPQRCLGCHDDFKTNDITAQSDPYVFMDYLIKNGWIKPQKPNESPLYAAIKKNGLVPGMPPQDKEQFIGTAEGDAMIARVENWIQSMPVDIESRYKSVLISQNLNIRRAPSKTAPVCGQFLKEDMATIDPRKNTQVSADGIVWSRVYIIPGNTRLIQGACTPPIDGVYFIAYK